MNAAFVGSRPRPFLELLLLLALPSWAQGARGAEPPAPPPTAGSASIPAAPLDAASGEPSPPPSNAGTPPPPIPAQPTEARPAAEPATGPLVLKLPTGSWPEQGEALRRALEEELGRSVVLDSPGQPVAPEAARVPTVVVTVSGEPVELAVSYSPVSGQVITRVVAGPASDEQRIQIVCLLVGSLVRQETEGLLPAPPSQPEAPPPAAVPEEPPSRFANASFIFPLATNYDTPELHARLSLNFIAGRLGGLEGLELGGFNRVDGDVKGIQVAYGGNLVKGDVEALQTAFLFNTAARVQGGQLAAGNWSVDGVSGFQFGFVGNIAEGKVIGAQTALGLDVSGDLDGLQVASINIAKDVRGFQLGAVNIARDFRGTQIGVFNRGGKVQGVTLGLVNVADDIEGVPVGLVNVTKSGGVHPMFWFASRSYGNFGVKFATRSVYSILSFSAHPTQERVLFGPGYALGTAIPVVNKVSVDVDLGMTHLFGDGACCETNASAAEERQYDRTVFRLRALGRYSFFQHLSVFAGGALVEEVRYPAQETASGTYESKPRFETHGELFAGIEL